VIAVFRGLIIKSWNKKPIKITAFALVIMLILFADSYAGYFYWRHLCATEGGINIFDTVSVSGYEDRSVTRAKSAKQILSKGYDFVEGEYYLEPGKLFRYYLGENGEVLRDSVDTPKSKYVFLRTKDKSSLGIVTYNYIVQSRADKYVLAKGAKYGYIGGWLIRAIKNLTGLSGASYCWNPFPIDKFVGSTLKPNSPATLSDNK
jgi:hypothetical protein